MQDFLSRLTGMILRLLPLLLMAIVAGATFWLVQLNSPREDVEQSRIKRHEPDYWMENFSATELAVDGSTKIRFTGVKMIHYEDD